MVSVKPDVRVYPIIRTEAVIQEGLRLAADTAKIHRDLRIVIKHASRSDHLSGVGVVQRFRQLINARRAEIQPSQWPGRS